MSFLDNIKSIPITDYAQRCGYTLVKKGNRYVSLKEHDSVMIDVYKNCFWRNSVFQKGTRGGAGSIIDFVMEFKGYDCKQAIREIAFMYDINNEKVSQKKEYKPFLKTIEVEKREIEQLVLPPRADNSKAVFRYLLEERKIDRSVIRYFLAKKMLYQDAKYSNCVFVSYKFACIRSVYGKRIVRDVSGSNYNECFFFRPSDSAKSLVVTESVIDIMSIMTYFVREKKRYIEYSYLALAGTNKLPSLFYHLEKEKDINHIMLAFDNDIAGQTAQENAMIGLQKIKFDGIVEIFTSPSEKDWNAYIQATAY